MTTDGRSTTTLRSFFSFLSFILSFSQLDLSNQTNERTNKRKTNKTLPYLLGKQIVGDSSQSKAHRWQQCAWVYVCVCGSRPVIVMQVYEKSSNNTNRQTYYFRDDRRSSLRLVVFAHSFSCFFVIFFLVIFCCYVSRFRIFNGTVTVFRATLLLYFTLLTDAYRRITKFSNFRHTRSTS